MPWFSSAFFKDILVFVFEYIVVCYVLLFVHQDKEKSNDKPLSRTSLKVSQFVHYLLNTISALLSLSLRKNNCNNMKIISKQEN